MTKNFLILLGFMISFLPRAFTQDNCVITYISNEGFLLEYNNTKVLIDAAFGPVEGNWCDFPSDETIESIRNAQPPFDNIDIIATTHYHRDHFNEGIVADHLLNNNNSILVCPGQVNEILGDNSSYGLFKNRIKSITPGFYRDSILKVAGIEIRIIRLEHSHYIETDSLTGEQTNRHRDVENVGFLFNINGKKFFHCGDTNPANRKEYETFALNQENIDVAFIERLFFAYGDETIGTLNNYISPDRTILMHINPANRDLFIEYFKQDTSITVFEEKMESIIINLDE